MARRRYRQPRKIFAGRYRITSEALLPPFTMSCYTIRDVETGEFVGEEHQWPSLAVAEAAALRAAADLDPDPFGTYTPYHAPDDLPFYPKRTYPVNATRTFTLSPALAVMQDDLQRKDFPLG